MNDEDFQKEIDENKLIKIDSTGNFGFVLQDTQSFDDQDFFGENILNFKLTRIQFWVTTGEKKYITGIKCFYRDRFTNEELFPGEYHLTNKNISDEIIEFKLNSHEYFNNFKISLGDKLISSIELITNKKRIFKIGYESNNVINNEHFNLNEEIILSFFGGYNQNLNNLGVYTINKKDYLSVLFSGIFYLRFCLKHKNKIKEEILSNENKLDISNKTLLKLCLLPETCFQTILQFALY
jgi:hypothetical protein